MQPLQYDLRCAAAKDTSIAHAAAPSNLSAKKHMVSCDFQRPNISLTQQFHRDLPAMPCKSHYNCFRHRGSQQDACSHYSANCNPRSPNPLAQRSQSSHWLTWKCTLSWQERNERKTVTAAPVVQTRFRASTPGVSLCEKNSGCRKNLMSKHHVNAAIPLRSAPLNSTLQWRTRSRTSPHSVIMSCCGECCDDVLLWWCTVVVMYCCGDVLLWWCIVVMVYCCDDVLL